MYGKACIAGLFCMFASISHACGNLDYEEMKDMEDRELIAEYCSAQSEIERQIERKISGIGRSFYSAGGNAGNAGGIAACENMKRRIGRILDRREIIPACR